jgi:hypothetical protein
MQETVVGIRKPKVKLSPQMHIASFLMSCRDVQGDCKTPQNERLLVLKERIVARYRIAKAFMWTTRSQRLAVNAHLDEFGGTEIAMESAYRFASIPFDSSHRVAVEPISWLQ